MTLNSRHAAHRRFAPWPATRQGRPTMAINPTPARQHAAANIPSTYAIWMQLATAPQTHDAHDAHIRTSANKSPSSFVRSIGIPTPITDITRALPLGNIGRANKDGRHAADTTNLPAIGNSQPPHTEKTRQADVTDINIRLQFAWPSGRAERRLKITQRRPVLGQHADTVDGLEGIGISTTSTEGHPL